jgi:hypothetical protein
VAPSGRNGSRERISWGSSSRAGVETPVWVGFA